MDKPTAAMLYGWIEKNLVDCNNPRIHGKALVGDKKGFWRYRIGNYRLIANIDDAHIVITIIHVGHRQNIYDRC